MDTRLPMQDWQPILQDPGIPTLQVSFQDSVLDNPPSTTRAGLFIYLTSMLTSPPTFSSNFTTTLLSARYNNDIPTLISDLILASFDPLANTIARSEPPHQRFLIRSFITNRLPVFLQTHYAPLIFAPLTPETCIRQALGRIDPLSSQSFDLLSETRVDFLFSCALHGLLPESHIKDILGETPLQELPSCGKLTRAGVVESIVQDTGRVEGYVGQLEDFEGNSGAIAEGLVEVMHSMCEGNDTMALRGMCNALSPRPAALDVLMLFTPAEELMAPFCRVVDQWLEHEEDGQGGGEHQPVYDEFGGVLLFVAAVRHRFGLKNEEMGVESANGGASGDGAFLATYFATSSERRSVEELTTHESEMLGSWIKGLYETEGISDELMSNCKPGEFHLLIATLLDQSIKACQAKVLPMETMKGGFEYLLEPFLLPSLVSGLMWFANHLWMMSPDSADVDVTITALQALLKPARLPSDSTQIHTAVLYIIARQLASSLHHVQRQFPARQDIKPLLSFLAPYMSDSERSALSELASWATTPDGLLTRALRTSIRSLVQWSARAASTDLTPPNFTFNQIKSALQILGAYRVLDALIDEVHNAEETEIALDVVAILILSVRHKKPADSQARLPMGLQTLLQTQFEEAAELSKSDLARAQTVVRTYRRVQAFTGEAAISNTQPPAFDGGLPKRPDGDRDEIDDIMAEAGAHGVTGADQTMLDDSGLDIMGIA